MADLPKRVWSGKKQVYSWKKPVWVKDWKLWVYDPNFEEVTNWQYYSPNRWGNLSSDAELQIYDDKDSLNPTDIGTFEDWLESTYQFVDWDGTVLKSWKVKDWETPVAPADPTREHYTFAGWNPTVWPITKNTTFSATYEIINYCVSFAVTPDGGWNVCDRLWNPITELYVPEWTIVEPSIRNRLQFLYDDEIIAQVSPEEATDYEFSSWGTLPATVTEDLTITATFISSAIPVTELDDWLTDGIDVIQWWTTTATMSYLPVNANDFSALTIAPDQESSYSWEATWVLTSYENWVATVTITWVTTWEYSLRATVENGGTSTSRVFHGYVVEPNL